MLKLLSPDERARRDHLVAVIEDGMMDIIKLPDNEFEEAMEYFRALELDPFSEIVRQRRSFFLALKNKG